MVAGLRAAICGALTIFACSSGAQAGSVMNFYSYAGEIIARGNRAYYSAYIAAAPPAAFGFTTWDASPGPTLVGTASTYNPFKPGYREGGIQTASGELYDPIGWTAAVQTDLRENFGGVHYGSEYEPAFALIEADGKRAIVKINDVGPLKQGRVIDFNEQTMRYFDPTLQRGLVTSVKITPLYGRGWTAGPLGGRQG
jgi:peptidoglycan lytic transglycosylase